MLLTDEQFNFLTSFEGNFDTALHGNWSRHPGTAALERMNEIWNEATKQNRKLHAWCQSCVLDLIKDVGRLYNEEKSNRTVAPAPKKRTRKAK